MNKMSIRSAMKKVEEKLGYGSFKRKRCQLDVRINLEV